MLMLLMRREEKNGDEAEGTPSLYRNLSRSKMILSTLHFFPSALYELMLRYTKTSEEIRLESCLPPFGCCVVGLVGKGHEHSVAPRLHPAFPLLKSPSRLDDVVEGRDHAP